MGTSMTDKFAIIVIEDEPGRFGVQLFADSSKAKNEFQQLSLKATQKALRAACFSVEWKEGKMQIESIGRDLPEPTTEHPIGHKLGEGPILPNDTAHLRAGPEAGGL